MQHLTLASLLLRPATQVSFLGLLNRHSSGEALSEMQSPEDVAARRGKSVEEILG